MLFFELIRIALGRQTCFSRPPSEQEWQGLLKESARQTVIGVTYRALNILPDNQRPPMQILLDWQATVQKIIYQNKRLNHDSVWVSKRFLKAGFRNAILKGQGIALLYPEPLLRIGGDIDVWLDGKQNDIIKYITHFFPKTRVQWQEVDFPIKKGTCIEVHTIPALMFHPIDRQRMKAYFNQHREEIFTNETELPGEEGKVCVPPLRVNMTFLLIHIYRHLFNEGIGLRQIVDYYYILQHCQQTGQMHLIAETAQMVRHLHMTRFVGALMWVMQEVFLLPDELLILPANESEGRFLLQEIMRSGNFGLYDNRNQHKKTKWGNFWFQTARNMRFLFRYPREVIWNPGYRLAQFIWRKCNGYR